MKELVVIGGIAIDYLSRVNDAKKDCTQVREYSENIGGMGYNTAVTASQLGVRTRLIAAVGKDVPEIKNRKNLILDVNIIEGKTTRSFLFFDDTDERIYFYPGAYHEIDVVKAIDKICGAEWVHFAGIMPCFSTLLNTADQESRIISFNPGYDLFHYDPKDKLVRDLVEKSDYLILNSDEARHLSMPIDSLVNEAAVVTLGKGGSVIVDKTGRTQIPTHVVDVESPFGAGDAYSGAFISSVMRGNKLVESAKMASAAASFAVEERTTNPDLDWEKIEKRAKKL
jgi:sugar/nucleoside kinase (ribokinase family)